MKRRQKESLADMIVIWGFVLSFAGLLGAGCFEAYKIVSVIPAAFATSSSSWSNPMNGSYGGYEPDQSGGRRMTPRERAQNNGRSGQPGR
jgi:hypothetical protein